MKKKVAIIGGGMAGLSAAYYLSKDKRFEIHLFERSPDLGGLLGILSIDDVGLEGFYHHLFKRDNAILDLVKELGLQDKLLYLPSKIGIFYQGHSYPFSSPMDLLHFSPLSIIDRLRLGFVALYLQKLVNQKNWKKLQKIPAGKWMRKYAGDKAYSIIWKPLLRGKFGEYADDISMAWLWSRLYLRGQSRGRNGHEEELVYLDGGFKVLVDAMSAAIKQNGGQLYLNTSIKKISPTKDNKISLQLNKSLIKPLGFNEVVVTVPNTIFVKLTPDLPEKVKKRLLKVKYRGAMVAVLQLKRQFMQDVYWLNIHDRSLQLLAVVEHTNFVDPQVYGGKHILYAGNYPAQDDPIMNMEKDELIDLIAEELKTINPQFNESWIEKNWVFRDRFAQPVVTTDYHTYIPPIETGIPNLYLVNMAQVYPEDRGTNQAVRDGKRAASALANL